MGNFENTQLIGIKFRPIQTGHARAELFFFARGPILLERGNRISNRQPMTLLVHQPRGLSIDVRKPRSLGGVQFHLAEIRRDEADEIRLRAKHLGHCPKFG